MLRPSSGGGPDPARRVFLSSDLQNIEYCSNEIPRNETPSKLFMVEFKSLLVEIITRKKLSVIIFL
jgi:hypothetical protein